MIQTKPNDSCQSSVVGSRLEHCCEKTNPIRKDETAGTREQASGTGANGTKRTQFPAVPGGARPRGRGSNAQNEANFRRHQVGPGLGDKGLNMRNKPNLGRGKSGSKCLVEKELWWIGQGNGRGKTKPICTPPGARAGAAGGTDCTKRTQFPAAPGGTGPGDEGRMCKTNPISGGGDTPSIPTIPVFHHSSLGLSCETNPIRGRAKTRLTAAEEKSYERRGPLCTREKQSQFGGRHQPSGSRRQAEDELCKTNPISGSSGFHVLVGWEGLHPLGALPPDPRHFPLWANNMAQEKGDGVPTAKRAAGDREPDLSFPAARPDPLSRPAASGGLTPDLRRAQTPARRAERLIPLSCHWPKARNAGVWGGAPRRIEVRENRRSPISTLSGVPASGGSVPSDRGTSNKDCPTPGAVVC
jgi:hypothetical protein